LATSTDAYSSLSPTLDPSATASMMPTFAVSLAPSSAAAYNSLQPPLSPSLQPSGSPSLVPSQQAQLSIASGFSTIAPTATLSTASLTAPPKASLTLAPSRNPSHVPTYPAGATTLIDVKVSALTTLQTLAALELGLPSAQSVSSAATLSELFSGLSAAALSEVVSSIEHEFGSTLADVGDMKLCDLAAQLDAGYTELGPAIVSGLERLFSAKMPSGVGVRDAEAYLEHKYGMPMGHVDSIMVRLLLTATASARSFTSVAAAQSFLDGVATDYASLLGYSLSADDSVSLAPTSVVAAPLPSASPTNSGIELFLELDATVEEISSVMIEDVRILILKLLPDLSPTDVHIEVIAGSVVLRVTVFRGSHVAPEVAKEELVQALRGPELQSVIPISPVEAVSSTWGDWTEWFSSPLNTTGDEELVDAILSENPSACSGRPPIAVYCQTIAGVSWRETGDQLDINCSLANGGIRCLNRDNPADGCSDYRMRIKCPALTPAPSHAPTTRSPTPRPAITPAPSAFPPPPAATAAPSEIPSAPFGCDGGCSGHGVCVDQLTGHCRCDIGWLPPNCGNRAISVGITADTNECQGGAVRLPMPSIVPGDQYVQCLPNSSRFVEESFVIIRLIATMWPVTCRMGANRSNEVRIGLSEITLRPNQTEATIPIRGVIDGIMDGVQPVNVKGTVCMGMRPGPPCCVLL
jgi:hypothetical protein